MLVELPLFKTRGELDSECFTQLDYIGVELINYSSIFHCCYYYNIYSSGDGNELRSIGNGEISDEI